MTSKTDGCVAVEDIEREARFGQFLTRNIKRIYNACAVNAPRETKK